MIQPILHIIDGQRAPDHTIESEAIKTYAGLVIPSDIAPPKHMHAWEKRPKIDAAIKKLEDRVKKNKPKVERKPSGKPRKPWTRRTQPANPEI